MSNTSDAGQKASNHNNSSRNKNIFWFPLSIVFQILFYFGVIFFIPEEDRYLITIYTLICQTVIIIFVLLLYGFSIWCAHKEFRIERERKDHYADAHNEVKRQVNDSINSIAKKLIQEKEEEWTKKIVESQREISFQEFAKLFKTEGLKGVELEKVVEAWHRLNRHDVHLLSAT